MLEDTTLWIRRLALAALAAGIATPVGAQEATSCDAHLPPAREVRGERVGPQSCVLIETSLSLAGTPLRRLDVGLSGSVEGFVTESGGSYEDYLTNAPDVAFGNAGDPGPVLGAITSYSREKGAALTLVFPEEASRWNGKLWVTVHGRGRSFARGNLKAWDRNLDPEDPAADLNRYDRLMLAKGYALVKTHRTSEQGIGELPSVLEDGRTSQDKALNDSARYVMDFTLVAQSALAARLGRAPSRTYLYGHSAGGRIGRGLNYTPGLNRRSDGGPFFDGILADDSAAGTWLPIVMRDGRDVLFHTEAERAGFVPQLEITHQMYNNLWASGDQVEWTSTSFLENKRRNARILRDKGLGEKHRMYEVRRISHSGGESLPGGRRDPVQILDLSLVMDRLIDMLDAWVERGEAPPPTRSDWPELGDVNGDGLVEHPALAFPEVACPLGVFFPYPPGMEGGIGVTAFAAFTGEGLEPRDGRGVFVDMNRNGTWDFRETPSQAWWRLGLLEPGEKLSAAHYAGCVQDAARRLQEAGFFSPETAAAYLARAQSAVLPAGDSF